MKRQAAQRPTAGPSPRASQGAEPRQGVRLQKYLSDAGVCSRRTGEAWIRQARVRVNGLVATVLGTRIDPAVDVVEVDGRPVAAGQAKLYIALHKPAGYVTSCRHPGQRIVMALVDLPQRVFPIGRLDKDSTGLLLLTNDGPLHHRLSHPSFDHEKTYEVAVAQPIGDANLKRLAAGVVIDDRPTRPAHVKRLSDHGFVIVLREGRNRQIRRMVEALGNRVVALKRIGFAGIALGRLAPGTWRHLRPPEVEILHRLMAKKREEHEGTPNKRARTFPAKAVPALAPKPVRDRKKT